MPDTPSKVFVLLFNARTENEGIHTLRIGDRNIVLMFEVEDDATRFGILLEAQDFPPVSVEAFESEEIEEFCRGAGYEAKLIADGTLMIPPENTVDQTDWDPDNPPEEGATQGRTPHPEEDMSEDMSKAELDRIRQRLENLL
ncbi:MAG: DUF3110 domain-containing protein [Cyanobacteria bacterium P01_A01_bin.105]